MKRLILSLTALGLVAASLADHVFTSAEWSGWTVQTGEETWYAKRHSSYPIWQMFDRDPKTAWVYSGGFLGDSREVGPDYHPIKKLRSMEDRYWLHIGSTKKVQIDEIRLMNGYNKDSFTFGRNAAITKLEIYDSNSPYSEDKPIKTVTLPDAMGWHSIKIPRRAYEGLKIVATALRKGTDPDVAISELSLLNKGKDVGPPKAKHVIYTPGDECGCGGELQLLRADGRLIAKSTAEGRNVAVSKDGRYFAGVAYYFGEPRPNAYATFWVYDAVRCNFPARRDLTEQQANRYTMFSWTARNKLIDTEPDIPLDREPKVLWEPPKKGK
jgi:hypothetical protein